MSLLLRSAAAALAFAALAAAPALATQSPPGRPAPEPKTTLAEVEEEVMCTVCGVPLSMAREAPAAKRERILIQQLIAEGKTKEEIKDELVATYGDDVLMLPARSGFDLVAWLVPLGLLLVGLLLLGGLLVTWKRRGSGPDDRDRPAPAPPLSPGDAELVDAALRERD
ncbi:MAG: cytochrome c-type biogenesis protein CcmH [Actinomycetes bacterium]